MTVEGNKALARRWYDEYLNPHDLDALDEIVTPDFVNHVPSMAPGVGKEQVKIVDAPLFSGFPDLIFTVEDMIAEGDKVVIRSSARGTHLGAFAGLPPTGKILTGSGIDVFRCANGKIVERWIEGDFLGFMQQIDALRGGK